MQDYGQCLGSGSVGSARFWLPGSGSAKICGSTDPDPRGKISTINCKNNFFTPKTQLWTFEKKEIIKISSFLNGSSSFRIKISEKIRIFFLKSGKSKRNDLDPDPIFFPVRIQDPDPHQNYVDPKHCNWHVLPKGKHKKDLTRNWVFYCILHPSLLKFS